jgi:hypothetical protein
MDMNEDMKEINASLLEPGSATSRPELLVSAALHLMSHYSANASESGACVKLASVIERHLKALADMHELAPVLRATCQQLAEQWGAVVEKSLPKPEKPTLLARIVSLHRLH